MHKHQNSGCDVLLLALRLCPSPINYDVICYWPPQQLE